MLPRNKFVKYNIDKEMHGFFVAKERIEKMEAQSWAADKWRVRMCSARARALPKDPSPFQPATLE
jgi:hypothetical protein